MLTINFGEKEGSKNKYIIINGIADYHSYYSDSYNSRWASIYNEEATYAITSYSHQDIKNHFDRIQLTYNTDWWDYWMDITFHYINFNNDETLTPNLQVDLKIETELWSKAWSISEFAQGLSNKVQALGRKDILYFQEDDEFVSNGFGITFLINNLDNILNSDIDHALEIVRQLIEITVKDLIISIDESSLTTFFHFPKNIRTSCEQYLIYFAQFLADIGIQVDTELKEETHHTLFRVTPKDKSEALSVIQASLEIYLQVASHPEFETKTISNTDIAIVQWQANVYHLKSQLALSQALMQAKDAQIEALQLSNYQYKQIINLGNSKTETTNSDEDIIKGVVTVRKFDVRGLSINLPEIFRRLKRKFN